MATDGPVKPRRTEWINFRATPDEADALYSAAYRVGQHLGDYVLTRMGVRETTAKTASE